MTTSELPERLPIYQRIEGGDVTFALEQRQLSVMVQPSISTSEVPIMVK